MVLNDSDKTTINLQFAEVQKIVRERFNKKRIPDLNAVLMLIGINELGHLRNEFTKEEKEYLMHIAVCHLLTFDGYYKYIGRDEDGWPHWDATGTLPELSLTDQEYLLKQQIIRYFELS